MQTDPGHRRNALLDVWRRGRQQWPLRPVAARLARRPLLRLAWCALGAVAGLLLALRLAGPPASPFVLASLGGSTVFLFGMTRAPAAQPRALFGGHLGGALIGIACLHLFGDSPGCLVIATALTLCWMLLTRTVHPPAGATPIVVIQAHAGWLALWQPVLAGLLCLVGVAIVWSRLYPGLVHYPVAPMTPSPPRTDWGGWQE